MSDIDRKTLLGLLDRMGASYHPKVNVQRAVLKLQRYVEKNGMPKTLSTEETAVMVGAGLMEAPAEAPAEEKKPEAPAAPAEEAKKEEKKPKPPKVKRPSWMECAAQAILESNTVAKAEQLAQEKYLGAGGRETENSAKWAKLYISYALQALSVARAAHQEGTSIIQG